MSLPVTLDGPWRFGPVTVWRLPHVPGTRGEPQARVLLAQQLGGDPDRLPLHRDSRGRPELHGPLAHLGTGWSHSHGLLLVALGEGVRLGVDLEPLRPRPRMREIIERFFHPAEVAWLLGLEEDARAPWFFRVWCVKEAILKAQGQGISFGLHRLQLAPDANGALHLAWCDPELGDPARWHLHEWQAAADFRAALAFHAL
ncbi:MULTISPECIES: 4'-phosphopantetheinyl transferase superfamily protein [Stenotrophomonas]|jgi:4'-phosphopantetheinyl transferase|uniref:4'-phosphopantetheinyl transferase superfamily protein n=1 Tax=Stenotrophomonas maltophilia TaxID=40324 RepID=A0A4S2CVF6_STEMA|nr:MULTISPECIES: 4'-phosphopantetheinyl transferase superfamily protein [Stenotrophomonas]MBD3826460.1 4'-phosphopantetheinyl transferase superfamily protein [Stenotrophomonas sp.]QIO90020.1 4-phosphopantetheinyl transferase [Stenotrophomonas rhizophila]TGY32445.1 4'-phosphopantetheinyl transferase superfamily protein [Stenotrophomonas maltophilia]